MEWGGLFFVGLIAFVCSLILIFALVVFWFDSRSYLPKDNKDKALGHECLHRESLHGCIDQHQAGQPESE